MRQGTTGRIAATLCLLLPLLAPLAAAGALALPAEQKPRLVVMTDIGGDPDDMQSLVLYLLYTCDFETEGFCTGFGWGHRKNTRPGLIRERVEAYGQVVANLRKHRPDYPSKEHLLSLIKDGHNGDPHKVGPGMDSEASEWIIKVLGKPDPRPVWFTIWGGPRELAQAVWKVSQTRSAKELAAFKNKIRVHSIADQDRTAGWVKQHHPDVFWIYSQRLFRGIWWGYDQKIVSPQWLTLNVLTGHGPLGPTYPPKAAGKAGVKEGDTPSFLYLLPGLSDPMHPEWGNWGGRFRRSGRGMEYVDAADTWGGRRDPRATIARWRTAYQNAFAARMDWCVKPYKEANHAPTATLNGDRSRKVLELAAEPGEEVKLSAAGSSDPDGHALRYRWWVYREAGSYQGRASIRSAHTADAIVTVPRSAAGRTVHVILEVSDDGNPPLTACRRAIINVGGEAAPRGRMKPITTLPGPPAETGPWAFYRGINIGGAPVTLEGRKWEGDKAPSFVCKDRKLNSPHVQLVPPTGDARAEMIHAFRWSRRARIRITGVPKGTYAVYAYVWEETSPETFTISLNGRAVARDVYSGMAGEWQRLGPWVVAVRKGAIEITSRGGAANFSGIEVWRKKQGGQDK